MLIIGLCLGSMAGAVAQRVSPVAEASQACKWLSENQNSGVSATVAGIDIRQAMLTLACSVDEIDGRLRALEQKQRELGDPK